MGCFFLSSIVGPRRTGWYCASALQGATLGRAALAEGTTRLYRGISFKCGPRHRPVMRGGPVIVGRPDGHRRRHVHVGSKDVSWSNARTPHMGEGASRAWWAKAPAIYATDTKTLLSRRSEGECGLTGCSDTLGRAPPRCEGTRSAQLPSAAYVGSIVLPG